MQFISRILTGIEIEVKSEHKAPPEMNAISDMCDAEDSGDQATDCQPPLNPVKVRAARKAEISTFEEMKVFEYTRMDKALRDPEGKIVDTVWVDSINGG